MDLKRFIYEFNLVSTLTVGDTVEWVNVLNNRIDKKIDYSNSINLYHFVESFNKLYLFFKKDYEKLEKLNLGEDLEILKFDKWSSMSDGSNYRRLVVYVYNLDKEMGDDYDTLLYLYEKDGEVSSYITNNLLPWEKGYYKKYLDLDKQLIKSYLDLGEKYGLLIDSYNDLKNKFLFGNGTTVLFSKINGKLLEELSTFEVTFGNAYFNSEDYINVVFRLGDSLEINYDESIVKLESELYDNRQEIIDELIHNLYINKDKLTEMYGKEKKLMK